MVMDRTAHRTVLRAHLITIIVVAPLSGVNEPNGSLAFMFLGKAQWLIITKF